MFMDSCETLHVKLDETVGTIEPAMPGVKDLAVGEIGKCLNEIRK